MMDAQTIGRILLVVGVMVVIIGSVLVLFGRTFDNFPSTIRIEGQGFSCVVPILASILLSIVGTIVLNVIIRLINRP
jgi:uncharacterized membrane-anchored protein YitT (DUF2179 family)